MATWSSLDAPDAEEGFTIDSTYIYCIENSTIKRYNPAIAGGDETTIHTSSGNYQKITTFKGEVYAVTVESSNWVIDKVSGGSASSVHTVSTSGNNLLSTFGSDDTYIFLITSGNQFGDFATIYYSTDGATWNNGTVSTDQGMTTPNTRIQSHYHNDRTVFSVVLSDRAGSSPIPSYAHLRSSATQYTEYGSDLGNWALGNDKRIIARNADFIWLDDPNSSDYEYGTDLINWSTPASLATVVPIPSLNISYSWGYSGSKLYYWDSGWTEDYDFTGLNVDYFRGVMRLSTNKVACIYKSTTLDRDDIYIRDTNISEPDNEKYTGSRTPSYNLTVSADGIPGSILVT